MCNVLAALNGEDEANSVMVVGARQRPRAIDAVYALALHLLAPLRETQWYRDGGVRLMVEAIRSHRVSGLEHAEFEQCGSRDRVYLADRYEFLYADGGVHDDSPPRDQPPVVGTVHVVVDDRYPSP